ncbi:conserved Plasmodium protein, unknown function [Plasmodium ovale wallikeri]|uniref:Uncharacterized protein n=2 Tax=Plasmodium ovale TaxID=36330 RepID=A0A1A8Z141_PLAOA|nr:conserved Plasmodium protein, unknown function [Plasmodium ovale wallikeri]SBT38211.1 conserved Plasmodium protein, unknown function [Plasmodium ovale wallikeri]SBT77598.1 conserved Plasmodium protein, unknown function [Plasmodium ovale]
MDNNIKDLMKKEKERRRLMREEKKKKENEKRDGNIPAELNLKSEPSQNDHLKNEQSTLHLKIKNNHDYDTINEKNDNGKENMCVTSMSAIKSSDDTILTKNGNKKNAKRVHFSEPVAPLNRLNRDNNFKDAFLEYFNEEQRESRDLDVDQAGENREYRNKDLPKDFFDVPNCAGSDVGGEEECGRGELEEVKGSDKEKIEEKEVPRHLADIKSATDLHVDIPHGGHMPNVTHSNTTDEEDIREYCAERNTLGSGHSEEVEIVETYEIIEDTVGDAEKRGNEDFRMKIKKKRKSAQNGEYGERDGHDAYDQHDEDDSHVAHDEDESREPENEDDIVKRFNNSLYDMTHYKALDTAYYEELEYLHKKLIEKKKYILGNIYDEEKEQIEDMEQEVLDELNEFHNKKNKNEKNDHFNIREVYELLNIKKGEYGNHYAESNQNDQKNDNDTKTKMQQENIPKGFFDDKEKDIFVRENVSLSKINQKIEEIKKQKKKMLLEYKNTEKIYEEEKNNYIDYLYDDNFDNKEDILNEIKTRAMNLSNVKNEVNERSKEQIKKKRKEKIVKKKESKFYNMEEDFFDWRKKNFYLPPKRNKH